MRSAHSLPELAPDSATGLQIARFEGDLDALLPTWAALEEPTHPGAPFRSGVWASAWWKTFSPDGELELLLARTRGTGAPIGLLPLYRTRTPLGGWRLGLLGEG